MAPADAAWVRSALAAWDVVRGERLKLPRAPRPRMITFDAACAYTAEPQGRLRWRGAVHGGSVRLPDGKSIPAGVASFAAPGSGGEPLDDVFLTMEGIGQWAAYAWFIDAKGPAVSPSVAERESPCGGAPIRSRADLTAAGAPAPYRR